MKKVLIVEDEFIIAKSYEIYLLNNGFQVTGIEDTGTGAIEAAAKDRPDCILMDIYLKGEMTGIQAAESITESRKTQIIFISGNSDEDTCREALSIEGSIFLKKPVNLDDLVLLLKQPG